MFEPYLTRWGLVPDGKPIATATSRLLPVMHGGQRAMLRIAMVEEERGGGSLMEWWDGSGAARILRRDRQALLTERACGAGSLSTMALGGRDDDACSILCETAARLHAPRAMPLPSLVPLTHWFRALPPMATAHGGMLARCDVASRRLLSAPQEVVPLHGDVHHENVLDFGSRGWLAIDPKGLLGERGFDFANIFCNPDLEIACKPGLFANRLLVVSQAAGLEPKRLILWIMAWCGLSAAFSVEDESDEPLQCLQVAELAEAELLR